MSQKWRCASFYAYIYVTNNGWIGKTVDNHLITSNCLHLEAWLQYGSNGVTPLSYYVYATSTKWMSLYGDNRPMPPAIQLPSCGNALIQCVRCGATSFYMPLHGQPHDMSNQQWVDNQN